MGGFFDYLRLLPMATTKNISTKKGFQTVSSNCNLRLFPFRSSSDWPASSAASSPSFCRRPWGCPCPTPRRRRGRPTGGRRGSSSGGRGRGSGGRCGRARGGSGRRGGGGGGKAGWPSNWVVRWVKKFGWNNKLVHAIEKNNFESCWQLLRKVCET